MKDFNFIYSYISWSSCKLHLRYAWRVLGRKLNHTSWLSPLYWALKFWQNCVYNVSLYLPAFDIRRNRKKHPFQSWNKQTNQPFQKKNKQVGFWKEAVPHLHHHWAARVMMMWFPRFMAKGCKLYARMHKAFWLTPKVTDVLLWWVFFLEG